MQGENLWLSKILASKQYEALLLLYTTTQATETLRLNNNEIVVDIQGTKSAVEIVWLAVSNIGEISSKVASLHGITYSMH